MCVCVCVCERERERERERVHWSNNSIRTATLSSLDWSTRFVSLYMYLAQPTPKTFLQTILQGLLLIFLSILSCRTTIDTNTPSSKLFNQPFLIPITKMILHYPSTRTSIADLGLGLAIHIKLIREQNLRSTWRPYLVPRYARKRESEKKNMIESSHGVPLCNSWWESQVKANGRCLWHVTCVILHLHGRLSFFHYEIKGEGQKLCLLCGAPYDGIFLASNFQKFIIFLSAL